ncbi:MAG: GNAT family N-acetyltransferase [Paludibacter sp.]|nr:GNAT family N-acetyltransferase [Paludibacter sp.]
MQLLFCKNNILEKYKNQIIDLYFNTFGTGSFAQYIDKSELEKYIEAITHRKGWLLLAVDNDIVAGVLMAHRLSEEKNIPSEISENFSVKYCVYISELIVAENARGKGCGKQLIETFLENIDKNIYYDALIRVWNENLPALRLYEKTGFSAVASITQSKLRADMQSTFTMNKIYLHKKLI